MTPENWKRIKAAFQSALELDAAEREVMLESFRLSEPDLHPELESLLQHHGESDSLLEEADAGGLPFPHEEEANPWLDRDIGPYKIVSKIGQGGMGSVYRAIRVDDHYLKNVAIKLVRSGFATGTYLRRFKSERQILATLDHPNIARLLDGGTTEDGLPYLVMEYIEGHPIDEYCDLHRLSTSKRLSLFLQVCSAVQYAHRNLVVHRDLKPANILVTQDGTPKLLDFGIAKLLDPELYFQTAEAEATMARAMSPEYASPEQVRGDAITTASDVYSLGVVLYRLLTGHPPYVLPRTNPMDWARIVVDTEPERPSVVVSRTCANEKEGATDQIGHFYDSEKLAVMLSPEQISSVRDGSVAALRRALIGDIDTIVLKALQKDPARRYASVEQLAEDIHRSLEGLPVHARPDTVIYRSGKFARRHKIPLAAVAVVVLSLTTGMVVALRQAHIAKLENARAERRFNEIRKISHDLIFEVHDSIQNLAGATQARKLVVQDALLYLNTLASESGDNRELQEELAAGYDKIGDLQGGVGSANLGDTAGALESHNKALAIRRAILKANPEDMAAREGLAQSYGMISDIQLDLGKFQEALENQRNSFELTKAMAAAAPSNTSAQFRLAVSYDGLGNLFETLNDWDRSVASFKESANIFETLAAKYPQKKNYRRNAALEHKKIGGALEHTGKLAPALAEYQWASKVDEELAAANPQDASAQRDIAIDYSNLGDASLKLADYPTALQHYRKALTIDKRLENADVRDASAQYYSMYDSYRIGDALLRLGNTQQAIDFYLKAVSMAEANSIADPANTVNRSELARVCAKLAAAHMVVASNKATSGAEHKKRLIAARERYRMSLAIWHDLHERGALRGADLHEPDEVAAELSKCDEALNGIS